MRTARRIAIVVLSMAAMLALLLAATSILVDRVDALLFYLALVVVAVGLAAKLWRSERRLRRAEEERLPPDQRPVRRLPRRPISFPLVESAVTFVVWYVLAVVVDRLVTGTVSPFTLVAIAPFAAFMLTMLTVAGRHMAFRLTAEEDHERRAGEGTGER